MNTIKVAELFAGVGGFRLGLEGYHNSDHPEFDMPAAGPYETIWANQWEPPGTESKQFAWRCYEEHFGKDSCVNEDINKVLDAYEAGEIDIPDVDMVVGGFPCQDYSVAKPLSQAGGIEGKKGVLWWDIYRFLHLKEPRYVLLENVDRLLKSPASQRGRDFAIILSCFADLGYSVEWRVINSAEYGFPQRRKRVYIFAELTSEEWDLEDRVSHGIISSALPILEPESFNMVEIPKDPYVVTQEFNVGGKGKSPFGTAGAMQDFHVVTCDAVEDYHGERKTLGDVIIPASEVPESFYVPEDKLEKWRYLKGSKSEERVKKAPDGTEFTYHYSEGSMAFPDLLENPSRTILTGEGGAGASRFKHIVEIDGRFRRLVPDELDQLQGFPKGWTNVGMSDGRRAFCMGNALVVGIPHLIGKEIARP
ncbi:DNA (cytosine-5-)-methyltransferase [Denitrobacterium detoxificans]|uniref:DNA (cytosine-5-)-methyltransferase n=1 Tax=Denitrobacterium detoxificans TaxID=79604 RepID=UPI0026F0421C|nr:DNA (cytosine-5-)-methyltransferase [Denitrobacterium detoxificans]MBE6466476.1 DNA (cytosine-5-)-methyltransferase [Denitrobacterium detoxificans]